MGTYLLHPSRIVSQIKRKSPAKEEGKGGSYHEASGKELMEGKKEDFSLNIGGLVEKI